MIYFCEQQKSKHNRAGEMLQRLEEFTSVFGAQFYSVPLLDSEIVFVRESWTVPPVFTHSKMEGEIVPFMAGDELDWQIEGLDLTMP